MLHRRQFLIRSLQGTSLLAVGTVVPQFLAKTALAAESSRKDTILVVVSEAVEIDGLEAQTAIDRDAFGHVRLDQRAIGAVLARHIEQHTGIEARQVVLGHLQRGGSPTAVDRLRATRFGNAAADLVDAGRSGVLPVLRGGRIEVASLSDAVRQVRGLADEIIELVRRYAGVVA